MKDCLRLGVGVDAVCGEKRRLPGSRRAVVWGTVIVGKARVLRQCGFCWDMAAKDRLECRRSLEPVRLCAAACDEGSGGNRA